MTHSTALTQPWREDLSDPLQTRAQCLSGAEWISPLGAEMHDSAGVFSEQADGLADFRYAALE
jgi:hypothetical protein